jgi:hypothetical protein
MTKSNVRMDLLDAIIALPSGTNLRKMVAVDYDLEGCRLEIHGLVDENNKIYILEEVFIKTKAVDAAQF